MFEQFIHLSLVIRVHTCSVSSYTYPTNQPAIEPFIHLFICLLLNSCKKKKKKKKNMLCRRFVFQTCSSCCTFFSRSLLLFFSYRISYWAVTMAFKQGRGIFCFFSFFLFFLTVHKVYHTLKKQAWNG